MELSKNTTTNQSVVSLPANGPQGTLAVVKYDAACSLCKMLAEFMGQRVSSSKIVFVPSEQPSPEKLEIEIHQEGIKDTLTDQDAWAWLIQHHPLLNEVNWIAQKLGISSVASRSLMRGAEILRKFCFRC